MALAAAGNSPGFRELRTVDVLVTVFTLFWRSLEINAGELGLKVSGFVAVDAGNGAMRARQREVCLRVIEARQLRPGFVGVTSLASHRLAVNQALHALAKLPVVRVLVTARAGHVLEVVRHLRLALGGGLSLRFVTLLASHRQVRSGQYEPGLLVPRQPKRGGLVAVERVTLLAPVQIRRGRELRLVFVFVAVEAATEFDLVKRLFAARDMALRALQGGVLALQGIGGSRMLLQTEHCRLESFHAMTGGAFLAAHAFCELSLMLIVVAIHTLPKSERLLEIALAMAGDAFHLLVFPQQRILGLGMIKAVIQHRGRHPFPSSGVVAGLTALRRETARMRIGMAIRTLAEG